jgi:hypothetical protein
VPDVLARSPRTTGRLPPEYALFILMPKRMRRMSPSRGVNGARTRVAVSRRLDWMAASMGKIAFFSSIKSPVGTPVADLLHFCNPARLNHFADAGVPRRRDKEYRIA